MCDSISFSFFFSSSTCRCPSRLSWSFILSAASSSSCSFASWKLKLSSLLSVTGFFMGPAFFSIARFSLLLASVSSAFLVSVLCSSSASSSGVSAVELERLKPGGTSG